MRINYRANVGKNDCSGNVQMVCQYDMFNSWAPVDYTRRQRRVDPLGPHIQDPIFVYFDPCGSAENPCHFNRGLIWAGYVKLQWGLNLERLYLSRYVLPGLLGPVKSSLTVCSFDTRRPGVVGYQTDVLMS